MLEKLINISCKSYYNILGTNICLQSPREEINNYCNFLLKEFICEKPDNNYSTIKVKEDFLLDDRYSIYKDGKIAYELGQELSTVQYSFLPQLLENIISGHAINQVNKKDLITLHAGALTKNGIGILIVGESSNGKSTLTLEMVANHHWGYLSDEVGLIDANYNLHPFPKTVSFMPGIVKLNPDWALSKYGKKYQVVIPKENYGKPALLKFVFFIKYLKEKEPEIQVINKSEALARLATAQIGRAKYTASLEQISDVVKRVSPYQILHNNCTKAAELIEEIMDHFNG